MIDSQLLEWSGVVVERGCNDVFHPVDVQIPFHYFALNCHELLVYKFKNDRGEMETVQMETGQIWVHPANVPFTHEVNQHSEYLLVAIDPAKAAACVPELHRQGEWTFQSNRTSNDPRLKLLMETLEAEIKCNGENGVLFSDTLVTAISAHFYRNYGSVGSKVKKAVRKLSAERFKEADAFLRAHITENVSIDDVARTAGLSRFEFIRQFKAVTGIPPHQYLLNLKLEEARSRLRRGMEIGSVAFDLGFADQSHFTRHFKARYKATPRQFRLSKV
jgi:AraC family transcriptional regulator